MNRKKWLAAVAALVVVCSLAAIGHRPVAVQVASVPVAQEFYNGKQYPGRAQHVLDGLALPDNPLEYIEEYGIVPQARLIGPTTAQRLLSGTTKALPVVVDYDLAVPPFKALSPGARAISETRVRVNHSQKINVLFGELYGLQVNRPEDFATGAYDNSHTIARFSNSVLYLDHTLGQMVTVIVSVRWSNYENIRNYLAGDISRVPNAREFFSSPEGVSMYEEVEPSPFVNERMNLRVWSARQVFPCTPGELSSRCLYKAYQRDFTHHDDQQVMLVGMAGTLQVNRPITVGSNLRFVDTIPVVRLNDALNRVLRVGSYSPVPIKRSDLRDPIRQMTMLIQAGGTQLDQSALANLKTYSFK